MTKRITAALLAAMFAHTALAGLTVTDPKSYTYYIKELKEATRQLEALQEGLTIATDTKNKIFTIAEDVIGFYNHAVGIADDLERIKRIINDPKHILKEAERIAKGEDPDMEQLFEEIDLNHDNIYVDLSDPEVNPWLIEQKRRDEAQRLFEEALKHGQAEQALLAARIETIKKLTNKIDRTENIKSSQDLTNRLLAELVAGQERLIAMLLKFAQAEAAAQFTSYNEEAAEEYKASDPKKKKGRESILLKRLHEEYQTERNARELFGL